MTTLASSIRCSGCGRVADPDDPYPFRCPRAGTDDVDHVLTRVLDLERVSFPRAADDNPYLRYRALMHSHQTAMAHGITDAGYCDLVSELDNSVARVEGHGFRVTPFGLSKQISGSLAFSGAGGVWVKNETGNVSGSHKGRHLMGVLIHLAVMERIGILDPGRRRDLAIASCGNAALAAAVVARACGWRLTVFALPDVGEGVVGWLKDLHAKVVSCPRVPGVREDPAYVRLRQELDGGSLPFTTQGNENGLTIESGETLGYELATDLATLPGGLDHLIVQAGGGALASSAIQALREAALLGALDRLPRVHTVQTFGTHPLERAYERVRAILPARPAPDAVPAAMAAAAGKRSQFMWPWEEEPKSVAGGILDDETYDWRAVVEGMLLTGGQPVVVSEDLLIEANSLATSSTGIPVDPTGSAGLAGLLALRRSGVIGDRDKVGVLFTGVQR